jgi:sugar lactone lactonase YvrE
MARIELLHEAGNMLGEGPIWHPEENALYWCDNLKSSVWRYEPGSGDIREWDMPEEVGSLVFRANRALGAQHDWGICAAMKSGFAFVQLEPEVAIHYIADPEPEHPNNRLNDGKCDRLGRYWCGSMDPNLSEATASLFRLDPDGSCHVMDTGFIVANGMAWSPDDRTMYFADSRSETVYAYDFDLESGSIANRRTFISTRDIDARVDGATVDRDGNYWCAHIHGGCIACYAPDGELLRTVELPVRHPTMCTFGGPDLDIMYVTSCTRFLEPGEAPRQPLAGALFAIHELGARGLVEPYYSG